MSTSNRMVNHCRECGRYDRVYRYSINASQVRGLVWLLQQAQIHGASAFHNLSDGDPDQKHGRNTSRLQHWGLIESEGAVREDGGSAGRWRATPLAFHWLNGETTVAQYAWVQVGNILDGFDGEQITVEDAMRTRFNLREMLQAPPRLRVIS